MVNPQGIASSDATLLTGFGRFTLLRRNGEHTPLPDFEQLLSRSTHSYYSFEEEKLLFVNVESDYARTVPLIEASLAYSKSKNVYLLDISRYQDRNFFEKLNLMAYDMFRGGRILRKCKKYLVSEGISTIELKPSPITKPLADFSQREELCLKLSIRNQNIGEIPSVNLAQNRFDERKEFFLKLSNEIKLVLAQYSIDRIFIWNGRFELSTVVALAAESCGVKVTKVEWGSEINNSFEIFREPPRNRSDAWARAHQFQREIRAGIRDCDDLIELNEYVRNWRINRFTERFKNANIFEELTTKRFVVFFTSSFWEAATYGKYVSEVDIEEIQAVKNLIRVAADLKLFVIIRVHPNPWSSSYEAFETSLWKEFLSQENHNDFMIIDANSTIDSYQLAEEAEAIFTVWSTIGFEAISKEIPTFLLCDVKWESTQLSNRIISDEGSFRDFLQSPKQLCLEQFRYIILYKQNYGFRFNHFFKNDKGDIFLNSQFLMRENESFGAVFKVLSFIKARVRKLYKYLLKYKFSSQEDTTP